MRQRPIKSELHSSLEEHPARQAAAAPDFAASSSAPAKAAGSEPPSPAIDDEEVENLAFYGLQVNAIALLLKCSPARLSSEFAAALERGRARQQQFLLEKLLDRVEANEWSPLRFALKNFCGMSDHPGQAALPRQPLSEQFLAQQSACTQQVLPSGEQQGLLETSQAAGASTPMSGGSPEQGKPPAKVRPRPRYPQQADSGGQHA